MPQPQPSRVERVFDGTLIKVDVETWPSGVREVVRHPGACAVVALTAAGEVVLVRQFREAVRQELLEIPAGIFDIDGEDGAGCAARELLEETGYRAANLQYLAAIYTSPGFANERIELFTADAEPTGAEREAGIDIVTKSPQDVIEAIERGDIMDAKTAIGLLLAMKSRF